MRAMGMSVALVAILAGNAWGQVNSNAYQKYSGASNPALDYFAGVSAKPVRYAPRRSLPPPRALQLAGISKPFSNIQRQPTISPYLKLDIFQSTSSLPNYYAYVKPQLQQQRANMEQQAQILRLQQKLRRATATGVISDSASGGMPTTGHSSPFLNIGTYFPGLR